MVVCVVNNIVIQGGLYTLPSHLTAGARDLIPRMLIVDPLKRITIPQIRQHHWFKAHLPRYLAVPPPDAMQHLKKACSLIHDLLVSIILVYFCYFNSQHSSMELNIFLSVLLTHNE